MPFSIQEDFTLMMEGTDGRYYLQAGAVCIPGTSAVERSPISVDDCENHRILEA